MLRGWRGRSWVYVFSIDGRRTGTAGGNVDPGRRRCGRGVPVGGLILGGWVVGHGDGSWDLVLLLLLLSFLVGWFWEEREL